MNICIKYRVAFFAFFTLCLSILFITQAFQAAEKKDFWTDEDMTLNITLTRGYLDTLLKGAKTQGSPAPLEYLGLRLLNQIKPFVRSFGLPFNIYYRLNSIFYTAISGLIVMGLVINSDRHLFFNKRRNQKIGACHYLLLLAALALYYFMPQNFHFSVEMRPYALWNSLWMVSMVLFLFYEERKVLLSVCLTFLAMTATASVFQLSAFAASFLFVKLLHKEKLGDVLKSGLKIFIIPTIICLYYVLGTTQTWNYGKSERYWGEFFYFWTTRERIFLLPSLGLVLASVSKKFQNHIIVFLTMLVLYLISPCINYITMAKGFFFSPRQYRYYDLIYPLFLISSASLFPYYLKKMKCITGRTKREIFRLIVVICLCSWLGYSFYDSYGVDKIGQMNKRTPSSYEYLVEVSQNPGKIDLIKLKAYRDYYKLIVKNMPHRGDAYGMLGFCYYHMGKIGKAINSYKKALVRNPDFFWFHYNLGVIFYKIGQYAEATESLEKALNVDYKESFKFIFLSQRIYQPILASQKGNKNQWLGQQALKGYRNCYTLLAESYRQIGENKKAEIFFRKAQMLIITKKLSEVNPETIDLEIY